LHWFVHPVSFHSYLRSPIWAAPKRTRMAVEQTVLKEQSPRHPSAWMKQEVAGTFPLHPESARTLISPTCPTHSPQKISFCLLREVSLHLLLQAGREPISWQPTVTIATREPRSAPHCVRFRVQPVWLARAIPF